MALVHALGTPTMSSDPHAAATMGANVVFVMAGMYWVDRVCAVGSSVFERNRQQRRGHQMFMQMIVL